MQFLSSTLNRIVNATEEHNNREIVSLLRSVTGEKRGSHKAANRSREAGATAQSSGTPERSQTRKGSPAMALNRLEIISLSEIVERRVTRPDEALLPNRGNQRRR